MTGMVGVCQWQYILTIINEITWILDICIFKTKQEYEKDKLEKGYLVGKTRNDFFMGIPNLPQP